MTSPDKPLLTEQQVASWLGVSTETLRKLRARGLLPFVKVGRAVRYDEAAVQRWLDGPEPAAGSRAPSGATKGAGGAPRGGQRARLRALHEEALRRASAQ